MLLFRLIQFDVRYVSIVSKNKFLDYILSVFSIQLMDFNECSDFDPSLYDSDSRDLIRQSVDVVVRDTKNLNLYGGLFHGVESSAHKLKVCLRQYAEHRFSLCMKIVSWLEGRQPVYKSAFVFIENDLFSRFYLRSSRVRIYIFSFPYAYILRYFFRAVCKIGVQIYKKIFVRSRKNSETKIDPVLQSISKLERSNYKIIFFQHKSIYYGNLFVKDYFYEADSSSPLYFKNILHIELEAHYSGSTDVQSSIRRQLEQGFYVDILPRVTRTALLRSGLLLIRFFIKNFFRLVRNSSVDSLRIAALMSMTFIQFHTYYEIIKRYPSAKLALVGYEILFPKPLSLALEASGVRTFAVQERFITTFYNSFSFILDTYACSSDFVAMHYKHADSVEIAKFVPTGMVRSDLFYRYGIEDKHMRVNGRLLVVVLNFHTVEDRQRAAESGYLSWEAHAAFHRDILALATRYPDLHFVIRGKTDDWVKIPFFGELVRDIEAAPNVEINKDYSKPNISYQLCSQASLIIAKHTSLADEGLSVGIPVVCHDYQPNSTQLVAPACAEQWKTIFCSTWQELCSKIDEIRSLDYKQPEAQRLIRQLSGGGLAGGHVRQRIVDILKSMIANDA